MRTVAVCGSKKFKEEIGDFCQKLEKLGVVVFVPNIENPIVEDAFFQSNKVTRAVFKGLTLEHFDKIKKADVCFIYNKGDYVGVSVTLEMAYACALGKIICALTPKTGDPCRDSLIDKVVSTPEGLVKLLK